MNPKKKIQLLRAALKLAMRRIRQVSQMRQGADSSFRDYESRTVLRECLIALHETERDI